MRAISLLTAAVIAISININSAFANPSTDAANWTPVLIQPSELPRTFKGSEGQWHTVYNLLLTNFGKHPATIRRLDIVGRKGKGDFQVIKSLQGDDLKKVLTTFSPSKKTASAMLNQGSIGAVWVNLDFDQQDQIPEEVAHRIVFDQMDQTGKPQVYDYRVADISVDKSPPVRISPPLRGGKWVVVGGYASEAGHRKAWFPIDNQLESAQTYAIDWLRLDEKDYRTHDSAKPAGYLAYDQPIFAVADGTIIGVVDKFGDQVPQKPSGDDLIKWPGGNSVVMDLGNGYYAFYAHLKPGSIKVKEGDKVTRGQEIARLGNSGNSTEPHLHMHVTRDPGILNAHGVPYVFDEFEVIGEINVNDIGTKEQITKPHSVVRSRANGAHRDELPRESHVLKFTE